MISLKLHTMKMYCHLWLLVNGMFLNDVASAQVLPIYKLERELRFLNHYL